MTLVCAFHVSDVLADLWALGRVIMVGWLGREVEVVCHEGLD